MVTANELLAKIHDHSVIDSDSYFVIDPITRTLENTARKKNVIKQFDHNSEVFTFELPRYVEGHDMLLCNSVLVHWNNIDGTTGEETAESTDLTDLRTNPDNPESVICSWTISRNSTQRAGILSFLVQYLCADADGNPTYEWHTDSYEDIEVRATKRNGPQSVIEYTDILEQWRARLFGVGDTEEARILAVSAQEQQVISTKSAEVLSNIELKGSETLATIPETYTEVYNMANEALHTKADAIILEAEGSVISVSDASDDHIQNLKIYGKSTQVHTNGYQLFDANKFGSLSTGSSGATIIKNTNGSFTISGSGTLRESIGTYKDYTHEETVALLKAGDLKFVVEQTTYPYVYVSLLTSEGAQLEITNVTNPSTLRTVTEELLADDSLYMRVGFWGAVDKPIVAGTITPMLYQDGDGTWEPYSGGNISPSPDYPQEIKSDCVTQVRVSGNNLCPETNVEFVQHVFIPLGMTYTPGRYRLSAVVTSTDTDSDQTAVMFYMDDTIVRSIFLTRNTTGERVAETAILTKPFNKLRFYAGYGWGASEGDTATITDLKLEIYPGTSEYEEPSIQDVSIDIPNGLSGVPVNSGGNYTDENGQQWICDEIDLERGVHIKRVKSATYNGDASEFITTYGTKNATFAVSEKTDDYLRPLRSEDNACALCDKLVASNTVDVYTGNKNGIFGFSVSGTTIRFTLDELMGYTVDQVREWLKTNPLTFYYALATPIETSLTAEEITAFKALRTNRRNTTILNDADAWMNVKYTADTKTYVENPKTLKLVDSSTGVVYELKIVDGSLTVTPV